MDRRMFQDLYRKHCTWEECPKNASVYTAGLDNRHLQGIGNLCPEHASLQAKQCWQILPTLTHQLRGYVCADLSFIGCSDEGSVFLLTTNSQSVLALPSDPCQGLSAISRFVLTEQRLVIEAPGAFLALVR